MVMQSGAIQGSLLMRSKSDPTDLVTSSSTKTSYTTSRKTSETSTTSETRLHWLTVKWQPAPQQQVAWQQPPRVDEPPRKAGTSASPRAVSTRVFVLADPYQTGWHAFDLPATFTGKWHDSRQYWRQQLAATSITTESVLVCRRSKARYDTQGNEPILSVYSIRLRAEPARHTGECCGWCSKMAAEKAPKEGAGKALQTSTCFEAFFQLLVQRACSSWRRRVAFLQALTPIAGGTNGWFDARQIPSCSSTCNHAHNGSAFITDIRSV